MKRLSTWANARLTPRRPKPDRVRALELLAGCGDAGCPEGLMIAHADMVELVRSGLASARAERIVAGAQRFEVARVRIWRRGGRRRLAASHD
jgi:hypothetical protein